MQLAISKTQNLAEEAGASDSSPVRRLVVLVPPDAFDEQALAMRIRTLSEPDEIPVLWLALASGSEDDHKMRHLLKYLQSVVSNIWVASGYKLDYDHNWIEAIQSIWKNGDRLVCLEGHMVRGPLFTWQSIERKLAKKNGLIVHVISGLDLKRRTPWLDFWREIIVWALAICIIGVFFYIQVYLDQNIPEVPKKILIALSILVELGLIAKVGTRW